MAFLKDETKRRLVCPNCRRGDCLWQGVYVHAEVEYDQPADDEAWHDIDIIRPGENGIEVKYSSKNPESQRTDIDDFHEWEYVDDFGCGGCGWIGGQDQLRSWAPVRFGWDGKSLRAPMKGQLELENL